MLIAGLTRLIINIVLYIVNPKGKYITLDSHIHTYTYIHIYIYIIPRGAITQ